LFVQTACCCFVACLRERVTCHHCDGVAGLSSPQDPVIVTAALRSLASLEDLRLWGFHRFPCLLQGSCCCHHRSLPVARDVVVLTATVPLQWHRTETLESMGHFVVPGITSGDHQTLPTTVTSAATGDGALLDPSPASRTQFEPKSPQTQCSATSPQSPLGHPTGAISQAQKHPAKPTHKHSTPSRFNHCTQNSPEYKQCHTALEGCQSLGRTSTAVTTTCVVWAMRLESTPLRLDPHHTEQVRQIWRVWR
jgi:hypothetical protein